jgi:AcrR family transcriptional regulator
MARQRGAILAVAIEQIAERGYDEVRYRDIASAARVSVGMLQHYFGSREELLVEAIETHCNALVEELAAVNRDVTDPWQRITSLIDHFVRAHEKRQRAAVWADFVASASRHSELRPPLARVYEGWRANVREAVDEGVRLGVFQLSLETDDAVDLVVATLDGITIALAGRLDHIAPDRIEKLATAGVGRLVGYEPGT